VARHSERGHVVTGRHVGADADWFGRDHVLVIQASANVDSAPEYARQIWATADHPEVAALQLLALLIRDRAEVSDDD
jgi:hypothetical protein